MLTTMAPDIKSTEISIRSLDNRYCQAIIGLVLPIQQDEFQVAVTLEDQPDLLDIEKTYLKAGGNFWGAFVNDELVGTIALLRTGEHLAALRKMFVRQAYRGKTHGVAGALLKTLKEFCREKGITHLYLGTAPQLKAAQRFYEQNGFVKIPDEGLPPEFPRMPPDKIFYFADLAQKNIPS